MIWRTTFRPVLSTCWLTLTLTQSETSMAGSYVPPAISARHAQFHLEIEDTYGCGVLLYTLAIASVMAQVFAEFPRPPKRPFDAKYQTLHVRAVHRPVFAFSSSVNCVTLEW